MLVNAETMVREHRTQLMQLRSMADRDLVALLFEIEGLSVAEVRNVLIEALPELVAPYTTASGELAATLFEDLRAEAGRRGTFYADVPDTVPASARVEGTARWAVGALVDDSLEASLRSRLSGSIARMVMDASRETIEVNGGRDRVRFQRMPRPGCCAFCGMLASRGAVYRSEASAGGGVKARGSMALGDGYHDDCQCVVMPVYPGTAMAALADATEQRYTSMYVEAVRLDQTRAVSTKDTLAAWRQAHGSH